jgi:hypothetical protein
MSPEQRFQAKRIEFLRGKIADLVWDIRYRSVRVMASVAQELESILVEDDINASCGEQAVAKDSAAPSSES